MKKTGLMIISLLSMLLIVISIFMIVHGINGMRSAWPPAHWSRSPLLPFASSALTGAAGWWSYILRWECFCSVGYIALLGTLMHIPEYARNRVFFFILIVQAFALMMVLTAPLPFNADQYAYVGYANLVQEGYNPYDPPLRSAPVSPQSRQIATVWSNIHEGGRDADRRIIVRDRYGPAWTLGTALVLYPFRAQSVEIQARILRLLAACAALACTGMMYILLRNMLWACTACAAFALHPLTITQTALDAHNDVFALFFVLGTLIALSRKQLILGGLMAGLSIGIKMSFLPYLPILLAYVYTRHRWSGIANVIVPLSGLLVALSLPFGGTRALTQPLTDIHVYNAPLIPSLIETVCRHVPWVRSVIHTGTLAFVYPAIIIAVACTFSYLLIIMGVRIYFLEALLSFLIFSAGRFEAWYTMYLVPLLFIPKPWGLPLFLGTSLASLYLERKMFIEERGSQDFLQFVGLAIAVTMLLFLIERRPSTAVYPSQGP
jgi:ALG3 protein